MKFRAARHTNNLKAITQFYHTVLGLEVLGSFEDHDGYNGIFLGEQGANWHLEFTESTDPAHHIPDPDDLYVFYPKTKVEYQQMINRFSSNNLTPIQAKNSYWTNHGTTYEDPDGFGVVIVIPTS